MEPTRDLNAQKVNNPTGYVLMLQEFEQEYLDPKIRQGYKELKEKVVQHRIETEKILHEVNEMIRKNEELLAKLNAKSNND